MRKHIFNRRVLLKTSVLAGTGFAIGIGFDPLTSFAVEILLQQQKLPI